MIGEGAGGDFDSLLAPEKVSVLRHRCELMIRGQIDRDELVSKHLTHGDRICRRIAELRVSGRDAIPFLMGVPQEDGSMAFSLRIRVGNGLIEE